jgi:hypothetical protein
MIWGGQLYMTVLGACGSALSVTVAMMQLSIGLS